MRQPWTIFGTVDMALCYWSRVMVKNADSRYGLKERHFKILNFVNVQ